MAVFVALFAGGNADGEAVFPQRKWTGGVRVVGARRVVGFVDVEIDGLAVWAILGWGCIDEACGRMGFFAAGEIAKDDEESALVARFDIKAEILAM